MGGPWSRVLPIKAAVRESLDRDERRVQRRGRHFYGEMLRRGDLCFDIGANVGNRVAMFRSLGAQVIAVEPQPQLASYLRARYRTRVTVVEAATGASMGTALLRLSSSHTLASMSKSFVETATAEGSFGHGVEWNDEIMVPVVTLDSLVKEHGLPRFVKIDVEGFEPAVLAGLSTPVPCLSFEYTPRLPELAAQCVERLRELGDYDYCYSAGETFEWLLPRFTTADHVLAVAERDGRWGDIYARLR